MCGIAGIYHTDGESPDGEVLLRMARCIAHRGPDGERFFTDGGLGLAHRHLRIIDLSDAAMQPMANEDGSLQLIFNGEIYNYVELRPRLEATGHRFSSHSDSEVILHAYEQWGDACLHRFNGMFAFALWDARRRRLLIARDRAGVKPLYYRWNGRTLAFASEIKSLLLCPGVEVRPNRAAIAEYMSAMYTTGEHTWFEGIKRLLPGHYLWATPEGLEVRQWWDLPAGEEEPGARPERYYVEKTRALLEDSVRLRLRSDVPIGSHLSGGIDSSAVVALLSKRLGQEGERVRTFSGAFAEGEAYDERRYVRDVVERYGTEHSETLPTHSDLPALLDRLVWHMDEPAAGPGILLQWAVCDLTHRSGVVVINGGQGGDEAWGGYFGYIPAYLRTLAQQARHYPKMALLLAEAAAIARRPAMRAALARAVKGGRRGRFAASTDTGAWAGPFFDGLTPAEPIANRDDGRTPLGRAMYYDFKWYLPALLQVEDRTSMAFSLESRAPLLDYRVLEHAALVPSSLKMRGLEMKHVLRRAVGDLLPPSVLARTDKMGMPTPIDLWFRGPLKEWVRGELSPERVARTGLFAQGYVERMLAEHTEGRADRSLELWKLLNVLTWWRLFVEGEAPGLADARDVRGALPVA
ncbi:MAG TPA: asparagine synthase (glutamine-hydrolyzing) [Chloroflexia bacterium]|nr:asparagine synthase (glutamine-hydrolyzing) [Chloroflexia bacterium]